MMSLAGIFGMSLGFIVGESGTLKALGIDTGELGTSFNFGGGELGTFGMGADELLFFDSFNFGFGELGVTTMDMGTDELVGLIAFELGIFGTGADGKPETFRVV